MGSLINAVKRGDILTVKRLLEKGADVCAKDNEALQWASENGHTEIVTKPIWRISEYENKDDLE